MGDLLKPLLIVRCDPGDARADLHIGLSLTADGIEHPAVSHAQTVFGVHIADDGDVHWIWDATGIFRTCPVAGRGQLAVNPSFFDQPPWQRYNLFLTGLFPLLLARGHFDLHAAAVAWGERGYLLVGESGSGKSTTALALMQAGWQYLSDDAVLVHRIARQIETIGFRRPFSIDSAHAKRWPALAAYFEAAQTTPGESKQFVDPDHVYGPERRRAAVRPSVLLFTTVVDRPESRLVPLAPPAALARLIPQSAALAFNRRWAGAQLDALARLVEQASAYELQGGRDVLADPEGFAARLAALPLSGT